MVTIRFERVTLVLGLGTILAHRPYRLGVHNDYPRQRTSPANDKILLSDRMTNR